eukprot:184065-Pyramimonas_sp.AAC.1
MLQGTAQASLQHVLPADATPAGARALRTSKTTLRVIRRSGVGMCVAVGLRLAPNRIRDQMHSHIYTHASACRH